jgi:hypothetical protein
LIGSVAILQASNPFRDTLCAMLDIVLHESKILIIFFFAEIFLSINITAFAIYADLTVTGLENYL